MNDVESFALVLSTISRSLVDLKGKNKNKKNFFLLINHYHIFCFFESFISNSTRKNFFAWSTVNFKR